MQILRVLLTGSSPFGGLACSAAQDVVQAMAAEPPMQGLVLVPVIIPAVRSGLSERVAGLIDQHQPDLIISLGIEPGIAAIRVEQIAINLVDSAIADNNGELLIRHVPFPGEPEALRGIAPTALMAQRIREAGIPAEVSDFAGTHLCNLTYYTALRQFRLQGRPVQCCYLHLALLPEQVSTAWPASMPFELQMRAVRIAMETMAAQARTALSNH